MRQDILKDLDGYKDVVRDIETARKYGRDARSEKGDVAEIIRRLHPTVLDLVVDRIVDETPSTKTLRLVSAEGYLPPFQAGQYVSLLVDAGNIRTSRPYSISSPPNQTGYYDITVRRVADGLVSNFLLDEVKEGEVLRSSGPAGNFHYNPVIHDRTMVCIAGGSGITPFMSMLREIEDRRLDRQVILFYGNKTPKDVIFGDELQVMSARSSRIKVVPVWENAVEGSGGYTGYISGEVLSKELGAVTGKTFFLCGPQALYDYCMAELRDMGVPARKIRRELYGEPVNVWESSGWPPEVGREKVFTLRVNGDKQYPVKAGVSLLTSLEQHGFRVPSLCRSGECSCCRTKIIRGKVYQPPGIPVRDSDRRFGYVHACVSYPLEDLEILI